MRVEMTKQKMENKPHWSADEFAYETLNVQWLLSNKYPLIFLINCTRAYWIENPISEPIAR